jgi:uncharacterized protein (TIGR03086 family)
MRHSVLAVAQIPDESWTAPTPCAEWDLRALLTHMTTENRGFAAAASGETVSREAWAPRPFGPDPRQDYAESADEVVRAFAAATDELWLPNIHETFRFPAAKAVGFHLLDYVVHTWDVAATIGVSLSLGDDLVAAAVEVAVRDVPDNERRHRPGAGFRPAVHLAGGSDPLWGLLAFLGRDPDWTPPRS